ncbi:MAG: ATP-binding protein [Chloroflexota bacterium]|nr:ATP-binding protein [Chloroflexota bacterium]
MLERAYQPRVVDGLIRDLLRELPAVMVTGPRAAGKTTTAERHAASVVHLDRPAEAAAFRADPDVALAAHDEPVLLDEWQEVPTVLAAVKRAVDRDARPGRFLLTGSVRADLNAATWPGTGRVVRVPMYGMTVREQMGRAEGPPFLDRLAAGERPAILPGPPDLRGYIELALASGFPEPALHLTPRARMHWLDGYIEQLLTRDAQGIDPERDPARLRRYFEAYALNTAGTVADATLFEGAGINRKTAVAYEQLLTKLFVVDAFHAWTSNRLKRLSRGAKRYLVDAALAAAAVGLDAAAVLADGDVLGRFLDTFVAAQIRAEIASCATRPRLYHLREEHGRHEIDILAELGGSKLLAFEVKADAAPDRAAARHLVWLRDRLGERFVCGVVFHTGPAAYELGDRVVALPICALWT